MSCNEYNELLSGHIDGENSEAEEQKLQEHLESCSACRELLEQLQQADAALRESKAVPPEDMTARIMAQVHKEPKKKKSWFKSKYIPVAAGGMAAAALLGFALMGGSNVPTFDEASPKTTDAPMEAVPFEGLMEDAFFREEYETNDETAAEFRTDTPKDAAETETTAAYVPEDVGELTVGANSIVSGPPQEVYDFVVGGSEDFTEEENSYIFLKQSPMTMQAPLMIVWSEEPVELSALQEPEESESTLAIAYGSKPTLYQRMIELLPFREEQWEIKAYVLSYTEMNDLLRSCVGIYETAVLFPETLTDWEHCLVLAITAADE